MLDALFRSIGYGLCHQLPERSFFAGGHQLPVCARDTGIYVGFAVALAVISLLEKGRGRPSSAPPVWLSLIAVGFVGAMAYDGITSYLGLRETTNDIRLATGILTGYAVALLVVPMLNGQLARSSSSLRVLEGWRGLAWLGTVPVSYAVTRWLMPPLGVLYAWAVVAAIIVTFVAVNLVFVGLIPRFERSVGAAADLLVPVVLTLLLTAIELALASGLRVLFEQLSPL